MPEIYKPKRNYKNNSNRWKRQEVYNTDLWKRMRLAQLMKEPLCWICLLEGKTTLGEDIHHIRSFMTADNEIERDKLAFDSNNLLTLCRNCHNRVHNGDLKGCKSKEQIKQRLLELGLIPISL